MPENWKTFKFEELYDIASGLSKSRDQFGFGHPFVTFKDVFYNWFLPDKLGDLANTNEKEQIKGGIKKGDIILTRTSETLHELGMSSVALKDYPNSTFNGFCKRLRQKEKSTIEIEPVFMAYFLRSKYFRNEISKYATMTTRASLNIAAINSLSITLPPFDEQQKIASILKPLDDKIENNLAMNKALEDMAMALYKHWFVDFVPFQEGKFIDSELGLIPEGWEVKSLDEEFSITIGRTPPRKEPNWFSKISGIKWISIKDMGNSGTYIFNSSEYLTEEAIKKKNVPVIPSETVILSFKLTVGRVAITTEEMASNEAIAHLKRNKHTRIPNTYSYLYLKCFDYNSLASTSSIATAVNSKTIKGMKIIVPENHINESFDKEVLPLFNQIKNNSHETETLTQLRDTLLPKLISGEVRLKEFEEEITAAL